MRETPQVRGGRELKPMCESRNEDYSLLWLGAKFGLADDYEVNQVLDKTHPMTRKAGQHGLQTFVDAAEPDPDTGPLYWLFVGRQLGFLGYKQGIYLLDFDPAVLATESASMASTFLDAGITQEPRLHVMVHMA